MTQLDALALVYDMANDIPLYAGIDDEEIEALKIVKRIIERMRASDMDTILT